MVTKRPNLCALVCTCCQTVCKWNHSVFPASFSERWSIQVTNLFDTRIVGYTWIIQFQFNQLNCAFLFIYNHRAVNSRSIGSGANNRRTINHAPKNGQNSDQKLNHAPSKRSGKGQHSSSENAEEQKMAIVLFFIVALYLGLCAIGFIIILFF